MHVYENLILVQVSKQHGVCKHECHEQKHVFTINFVIVTDHSKKKTISFLHVC